MGEVKGEVEVKVEVKDEDGDGVRCWPVLKAATVFGECLPSRFKKVSVAGF